MRQCSCPTVPYDAAVVENLLKFSSRGDALASREICLAVNVCGIQTREVINKPQLAKFNLRCDHLQVFESFHGVISVKRNLGAHSRKPQGLHLGVGWTAFIQLLRQRLCSLDIACQCERQRRFNLDALALRKNLKPLACGFLCLARIAERCFSQGGVFLPYCAGFLAVCAYGG